MPALKAELTPEFHVRLIPCVSVDLTSSHTLHHPDLDAILLTRPMVEVVAEQRDDPRERKHWQIEVVAQQHTVRQSRLR